MPGCFHQDDHIFILWYWNYINARVFSKNYILRLKSFCMNVFIVTKHKMCLACCGNIFVKTTCSHDTVMVILHPVVSRSWHMVVNLEKLPQPKVSVGNIRHWNTWADDPTLIHSHAIPAGIIGSSVTVHYLLMLPCCTSWTVNWVSPIFKCYQKYTRSTIVDSWLFQPAPVLQKIFQNFLTAFSNL